MKQVPTMPGAINSQAAGEFRGASTQAGVVRGLLVHKNFHRPEKDESFPRSPFYQDVEEPVNAVIQIDIGGSGGVFGKKLPGRGPGEGVASRVSNGVVGLGLNDTHPMLSVPPDCPDQ